MIFSLARLLAVALPLLLAGCASIAPPKPSSEHAQTAGAGRPFFQAIELGGRLSVRYQGERAEEVLHGSFTWSQTPAHITVNLLSPLGQTMAIIDVTADGAILKQGGQPVRTAANVDALTADTLGWPLPVAGLREWLQGFALDRTGQRFIATPASSEVVTRDGWRVHYANWIDENPASPHNRPRRIDLVRTTEQAGNVSIRIVIDTWQPR